VSASNPNLFSCKLIAVVIAGREVLMVRKRHTGLWDLPGGDLRVGEHPEAGIRRIVESDSSTVVAIAGLVGIYNRCTPRLSLVLCRTRWSGPRNRSSWST
jgi:ADP-ribose pyrophosphatase YjhB (NUDIX family)